MSDDILIDVRGMKKYFPIRKSLFSRSASAVRAVDDVSFYIRKGETLGLVGESGCGKTTTGRCVLRLIRPTGGHVYWKMPADVRTRLDDLEARQTALLEAGGWNGSKEQQADIEGALKEIRRKYAMEYRSSEDLRHMRRNMQIVFQDPYSSLNPRMLIKDIVGEPLQIHGVAHGQDLLERTKNLMEAVGLSEHLYRFPHEFSGGQRQRIGVARRSRSTLSWWCSTSRPRHWTCPCRRRY